MRSYEGAPISFHVVWIDVLPSDDAAAAARASRLFDDPRVTQYHDPAQVAGRAFAEGLLRRPPAWDLYLFYPAGARWTGGPPMPASWAHQLSSDRVADPARRFTGAALATELHAAMARVGAAPSIATPPSKEHLDAAKTRATETIAAARAEAVSSSGAEDPCARCRERGGLGQCSVAGWRQVTLTKTPPSSVSEAGALSITASRTPPGRIAPPGERTIRFSVDGLACPDCMTHAAAGPLALDDVVSVHVDLDSGEIETRLRPWSALDGATIVARLEGQGVSAREIESR